jgi:hypothetical protein
MSGANAFLKNIAIPIGVHQFHYLRDKFKKKLD